MQVSPRNHGETKHFFELLYIYFIIPIFRKILNYIGGGIGVIIFYTARIYTFFILYLGQ